MVSANGTTNVTAGESAGISCTVTLPNNDSYIGTSVNVMWTGGLSTMSYEISANTDTVTDIRSFPASNISDAGTYNCTAQVVYSGSLPVMDSSTSSESTATLRVQSKCVLIKY